LPIVTIAAREQRIAQATGPAVRVVAANLFGRHAASDGLVAGQPAATVGVAAALDALAQENLAAGPLRRAVGIAFAPRAPPIAVADAFRAVGVVDADFAGARRFIAGGSIGGAVGVDHAPHTAIARHVAPLAAQTVCVVEAPHAFGRRLITDAGAAMGVLTALHTPVGVAIAALVSGAVGRVDAPHADVLWGARAVGTVGVVYAGHADVRGSAARVRAVSVFDASHARILRAASAIRAVGVFDAGHTRTCQASAAATVPIFDTGRAAPVGTTPAVGAISVARAFDADALNAAPGCVAIAILSAAFAAGVDAFVVGRTVACGAAIDAERGHADPQLAVHITAALNAPAGATEAVATIHIFAACGTARVDAAPFIAIVIAQASHAPRLVRLAAARRAIVIFSTFDAAPARVAHPSAQAVAIGRALDTDVEAGIADGPLGALGAAAALHALTIDRIADALGAIGIVGAFDAAGLDALAGRAVGVLSAIDAATSGVA
jgi:hypothetical protein